MIEIDCPSDTLYGLPVPPYLLDLQRLKVTDYESSSAGMGVSIGYRASDIELTIYFYDLNLDEISDDVLDPVVRQQFDQVTHDVLALGERNNTPIEVVTRYVIQRPQIGNTFLATKFIGQDEESPYTSFALLAVKANKFVKLRATCRLEPESADTRIRQVADAYADLLWR